jgi:tetratricopeptide (TPR) repeat protein
VLRGVEYLLSETNDGNAKARQMFEKATQLDPKYADAYRELGTSYYLGWVLSLSSDANSLERAFQLEQQAIALDESSSSAHSVLAKIYAFKGQYDRAINEAQLAIVRDPNFASGYFWLADVMNFMARPAEALGAAEKAMRLDPRARDLYSYDQGFAYTQLGRYEEAIVALKRAALTNHPWDHVWLVWDYTELGREDDARAEAAEVERHSALNPNSPAGRWALAVVMNDMAQPAQALVAVDKGMRLDPHIAIHYLLFEEGKAYQGLGRYEDSIVSYKRFLAVSPGIFWAHLGLAVDYIELGQEDAARAEAAEVFKLNPQFNLEMVYRTVGPKGQVLARNTRWCEDLRKAGLK